MWSNCMSRCDVFLDCLLWLFFGTKNIQSWKLKTKRAMFCGGQPVPLLLLFHRSMGCPQWVMKAIESCKLGALGGHPEFQISIWDPRGHHNRRALLRDSCFVYFLRPFRFRCCFVKFGSLRETLKRTSLTKLSPAFPQLLSVADSFATLLFATLPFRYWRDAACCISVCCISVCSLENTALNIV